MNRTSIALLLISGLASAGTPIGPNGVEGEHRDRFWQEDSKDWQEVFFESGSGDWQENWYLDGLKATVTNSDQGMDFHAGPVPREKIGRASCRERV